MLVTEAYETFPELEEWSWPARSAEAEKASFYFQANRFVQGEEPSIDVKIDVMKRLLSQYPTSRPLDWDDSSIWSLVDNVMNCAVNKTSSPGLPLASLAKTNAKLFEEHGGLVLNCAKERLLSLATTDSDYLRSLTAEQLVQRGFCDPVRVFVKNEPHNRVKVEQGRLRLISSIAIVDQIIERVLHTSQNEAEIEIWDQIPSKPGGSMGNDEDVKKFATEVFQHDDLVDVDISGFDWSVQGWELDLEMQCRIELAEEPTDFWVRAAYNRMLCLSLCVFAFSDGQLIAQRKRCLQKSGSFLTASANSRIKIMIAYIIGCIFAIAYGDDGLEQFIRDAVAKYYALGHIVKSYNRCKPDYVEFCSTRIARDGTWTPLTWSKTLYRFLCQKEVSFELWLQFKYTLRHCEELGRIKEFIIAKGGVLGDKINGWEQEEEEFASESWC